MRIPLFFLGPIWKLIKPLHKKYLHLIIFYNKKPSFLKDEKRVVYVGYGGNLPETKEVFTEEGSKKDFFYFEQKKIYLCDFKDFEKFKKEGGQVYP